MADHQGPLTPNICTLLSRHLHNHADRLALMLTCRVCARTIRMDDPAAYPIFKWPITDSEVVWKGRYTSGNFGRDDREWYITLCCSTWSFDRISKSLSYLDTVNLPDMYYPGFSSAVCNIAIPDLIDAFIDQIKTFYSHTRVEDVVISTQGLGNPSDYVHILESEIEVNRNEKWIIIHKNDYCSLLSELMTLDGLLVHESRLRQRNYINKLRQGLL